MRQLVGILCSTAFLTAAACNKTPESQAPEPVNVSVVEENAPGNPTVPPNNIENEAAVPEKPSIDLEIGSVALPGNVARNATFPIVVDIQNHSGVKLVVGELQARAAIQTPTDSMDLYAGSGSVRDLGPGEITTVTFTGHAPHVPGQARITVTVKPVLATDPNMANNSRTQGVLVN